VTGLEWYLCSRLQPATQILVTSSWSKRPTLSITMMHSPMYMRCKSCLVFLHCGIPNAHKFQLQKQKYISLYKLNNKQAL